MTESFLHFLWKYRLYGKDLLTTGGEELRIIHPGLYNRDSGPDFFDARILIGNTRWAGNVEIHLKSSAWKQHGHSGDKAYESIILHVVYEDDEPLTGTNGIRVPCLELRSYIDPMLFVRYESMLSNRTWVPCAVLISEVPAVVMRAWLERILVSRLESRLETIERLFSFNGGDMDETFYQWMARSFGFKVNTQPFEMLSRSLSYKLLLHHAYNPHQVEALIFGQSGLLEKKFKDEYPLKLQQEYSFLKKKFQLTPIAGHLWKYLRLRPANFPDIRLAQWASLMQRKQLSFASYLETENAEELLGNLSVEPNHYWTSHYRLDKPSEMRSKPLGQQSAMLILINAIIPFMFFYGRQSGRDRYCDISMNMLAQLPPEKNALIAKWQSLGINAQSASDTQALIELKTGFCRLKRCLDCAIGVSLIR